MTVINIVLGFLGLGIVVFVHELGHFLAARAMGIDVEAFSIGWGKPILRKKIGAVEYRIGMFPLGGYCKMKDESGFQSGDQPLLSKPNAGQPEESPPVFEKGSYMAASPLRRIVVCFAGPLFNLLFAAVVLSFVWGAGFETSTLENRIVLASDIDTGAVYPADEAGLKTGDRIIEINGNKTANYHEIQENIAANAEALLNFKVERNGAVKDLQVRPALDKSTGAGKIGVYFWTDPVIASVAGGSPAEKAGLQPSDRILRVNGENFPYSVAILSVMKHQPETLALEYERNGTVEQTEIALAAGGLATGGAGESDIGITYEGITYKSPRLSPIAALGKGLSETAKTFSVSVKSLGLLFRGIDLTKAVSGPIRITYMTGDIAVASFSQSVGAGFRSVGNFLSLISIALCIMNLLPIPIVDGGMIVLFIIEGIRHRPLPPRFVQIFQTVGVVLILSLMLFAVYGDILFLVQR
ncbi:zinc metalloprotease [Spirochaetia bacterium]|nr:zinc metalloprotease [Spirochaetia bacterium]